MQSRQRYETGKYHTTTHVGGGSDHEGQRLLAWLVVIVILALTFLAVNGGVELLIDAIVGVIIG